MVLFLPRDYMLWFFSERKGNVVWNGTTLAPGARYGTKKALSNFLGMLFNQCRYFVLLSLRNERVQELRWMLRTYLRTDVKAVKLTPKLVAHFEESKNEVTVLCLVKNRRCLCLYLYKESDTVYGTTCAYILFMSHGSATWVHFEEMLQFIGCFQRQPKNVWKHLIQLCYLHLRSTRRLWNGLESRNNNCLCINPWASSWKLVEASWNSVKKCDNQGNSTNSVIACSPECREGLTLC